jgi:hypothetical protein
MQYAYCRYPHSAFEKQAVGVAVGDEDAEGERGLHEWFNAMHVLC